jgi:hypothetical protein
MYNEVLGAERPHGRTCVCMKVVEVTVIGDDPLRVNKGDGSR